jgi:hypothetical protein
MTTPGKVRVGRRVYGRNGTFTDPKFPEFKDILCLTKSTKYGSLGPYVLKDRNGRIMENIWQFSKVYETVPRSRQTYSRYDHTVIWDHPAEIHSVNDILTTKYKLWRQKGMECVYPIRYPVGLNDRGKCIGSIQSSEYNKCVKEPEYVPKLLTYIEARKEIYLKTYLKLVKKEPDFAKLLKMLKEGKNLLIIEVDGPHEDHLDYYKTRYGVGDDFIINNTILASQENMDIMLNDDKFPFGHGYCLALALNQEL